MNETQTTKLFRDCIKTAEPAYKWSPKNQTALLQTPKGLFLPVYYQHGTNTYYQIDYSTKTKDCFDFEYTFQTELQYTTYGRGRSAVCFYLANSQFEGQMFISDFDKLIHYGVNVSKPIYGTWGFRKQGQNIGLIRING